MRRVLLTALAALVALTALPAIAEAARGRVCKGPTALKFKRKPGATSGRLSWRPPNRVRRGTRYRVYRSGAVIGQTKRSWMRVRVSVGLKYRFVVRLVSRRGRPLPCRAGVRKLVAYVNPTAPRNLAVTGVDGPAAHLEWMKARGGDARVVAYRVFRSGVTFKQVRATSADVPISNSRSYRFAVAAVDARGKVSKPTRTIKVDTDHKPPPAPATVIASAVTDSELTLSWAPSKPARGRVVGYRIYRDGKVLRQVKGLSTRVTNLAAGTPHVFTVAAVDGSGWLSEQSRPARISTKPPVPTTGNAHAFLLATHGVSWNDFRAHYDQIGVVYPTYFDCAPDGKIEGADQPLVTRWAQQRRVKVLARFNCQRQTLVNNTLTDPALREYWLDQIVGKVMAHGYDGAQYDFEKGNPENRGAYTSFVAELASRLHARGKKLSVAVSAKTADIPNHPRSTVYDYQALAQHADWIFVMAWGIKWQTSGPGAPDDIRWFRNVVNYTATMPDHGRFVIGTQLYGLDWASGGGTANPAKPYEYADMRARIARIGAHPRHDATTDSWTYSYSENGVPHEVWYTDAGTTHNRMQLARANGFGIGFWRLGNEDQRIWSDPLVRGG